MLSDEDIEKFREIYKSRFGKEITKEEAYAKGVSLLRLVELVYKPMTISEYNQLQKRRKKTGDI